ncbi:MAG: patatin-like phospholipase family protein [Spirochaetaceae bacterium]|nr:patatin-like phospholipase family protein [Spirochaetaceae bacterium]
MSINKKLKYAIVLSGGGARGLVHAGVFCALEEAGYPPPSLIAGTSMGAVIGGLYASGMGGAALKRYVRESLDIGSFMESPVFRMDGPLGRFFQTGQIIGNIATRPGIDSGSKVMELLEELTEGKNIEECQIPFLCNAVDLNAGQEVVFRSGSLARAIRSSMSFPFFFEPLVDGRYCLVDGGVVENMPVGLAREAGKKLGIRRILAIDTRRWDTIPSNSLKNGGEVVLRCFDVMVHIAEECRRKGPAGGGQLVVHAADGTSPFDFSRKQQLLDLGEAAIHQSRTELGAFFGAGPMPAMARRRLRECGIDTNTYFSGGIHAGTG